MSNVYKEHGYKNRMDYLKAMADEYDADLQLVMTIADALGEGEDFDGLVVMLEDLHDE